MNSFLLAVLFTCIPLCNGGKILYMSFPLFSRVQIGTWLKDDLKIYGHDLWITYPQFLKSRDDIKRNSSMFIEYRSLGTKNIDDIVTVPKSEYFLDYDEYDRKLPENYKTIWRKLQDVMYKMVVPGKKPGFIMDNIRDINDKIKNDTDLLDFIKQQHFDLVIVDKLLDYHVILSQLKIPFCIIGEDVDAMTSGNMINPSHIPIADTHFTDKMDLFKRVCNTMIYSFSMFCKCLSADQGNGVSGSPSHLVGKAVLWLVIQDSVVDYPRSAMPNTKYIGGLSIKEPNPLKGKFKDFYNKASDGVIVVSFGEDVLSLNTAAMEKLFKAFQNTKYSFVISMNVTSPDEKKFLTSTWMPLNDLLANHNTKLFITNCDVSHQYLSLSHGVPMLALPVTGDHVYHAKRLERKGYGVHVNLIKTAEDISNTIENVIATPTYRKNVVRAAKILSERPLSAGQEASYWIDHVIKYGDSHIRSTGVDLPWYKYLCVDVALVFAMLSVFFVWLVGVLIKLSLPALFRNKDSPKTKYD